MSPYRFEGQSATVGPAEKKVVLDGMLGTGSVASLVANVATPVRVRIPSTVSGETVVISAPNGGKIERRNGRLAFPANGGPLDLDLVFTPTLGNGAYTISIRHAGDLLTYQFWAGPRRPSGQPGTPYVPPSPETLAAEVASLSTDQRAAE